MTRQKGVILAAALLGIAGLAQDSPQYFELLLPDFSDQAYPGGATTVEHPPRPIERLTIQLLNPYADTISYGNIFVKVNGKGLGNAFERRASAKGKILLMTPASLHKRSDELFDASENAIEVRAVDPRGRNYYQNWVLRASEAGRNAYFSYSTTVSAADPQGVPPDLILVQPTAPVTLRAGQASSRVTLKGTVSGRAAGTSLTINGKLAILATQGPSEDFNQQLTVDRSTRSIVLEALDEKKNRRSVTIPIILQGAPAKLKFAGGRYAVVVGVSRFGNNKGAPPPIEGAARDAAEFAKQLEASAGFTASNIRLLLDDHAPLDQVKIALGDFAAQAKANDLVVIYVATHGMHDPLHPDQVYLAAADTQMDHLSTTGLELGELETLMDSRVRCNNVLLLFDVGHALNSDYRFPAKNLVNNHLVSLFGGQEGRAVLVSGSADQVSLPAQANGPLGSSFARWVAQGLGGKADQNYDGVVTADELFRFVTEHVREESGDKQTPRFRLGGRPDMQIAGAR